MAFELLLLKALQGFETQRQSKTCSASVKYLQGDGRARLDNLKPKTTFGYPMTTFLSIINNCNNPNQSELQGWGGRNVIVEACIRSTKLQYKSP
jgi:hypothetical protein